MTTVGSFEIEGSFKLTERGLLIFGKIISGTVSKDNYFTFNVGQNRIELKIKGVDYFDNIKVKMTKIGLTFDYHNTEQFKDFQTIEVKKQIAKISEL